MAQGHVFPKQQIEIVQVLEPKGYGNAGKELLPVMAKNLSLQEGDPLVGKSLKYTVFNQALQDHIKPLKVGARFLADIEERDRSDSQYGPDRNINQIYIDGNPISQKQVGGGGYRGRSLEDDIVLENVKRRSIEGQTAIAQVGNVLSCPTPLPGEDLGLDEESWKRVLGKYWRALERSLDNFLAEPTKTQAAKLTTEKPPLAHEKNQGAKPGAQTTGKVSNDQPPVTNPIKHVGDLLTRANRIGVNPAEVATACGVIRTDEIKDLEGCWLKVQEFAKKKADPDRIFE